MFSASKRITTLLLPLALVGATTGFVAGCGSDAQSTADQLKKKATDLQSQTKDAQAKITQISADIKSGKITAKDGQAKIESIAKGLQKSASDSIDTIKDNAHLTDAEKKQLEDAKNSLK